MTNIGWMVTRNNPTEEQLNDAYLMDRFTSDGRIAYAAWNVEKAPTTGTIHLQMYIHYKKSVRKTTVMKLIPGCATDGILRRLGTVDEAVAYVTKDDTRIQGPFEYGSKPKGQGHRTDLDMVAESIREGKTRAELAELYPRSVIMHGHGMERLMTWQAVPTIRPDIYVCVKWGPTGVGKSHSVIMNNPGLFIVDPPENGRMWFDGYESQLCVLLDDFRPDWMRPWYLLRLLEKWPMRVAFKGGMTAWVPTKIYITTDANPVGWFEDPSLMSQILRRITKIEHIPVRP